MITTKTILLFILLWIVKYLLFILIVSLVEGWTYVYTLGNFEINLVFFAFGWVLPMIIADDYNKYLIKKRK